MKLSEAEHAAIQATIAAGVSFGFGNLIAHLQTAWARTLMADHGMDEETARVASGGAGYSFAMAEDLAERGEWDETGVRYGIA